MPASMISAPTGGRPYVIGSSIAMVATGPMPGNTPIRVPTSAPTRHRRRFCGVAATLMPNHRLFRSSIMAGSPRPELKRKVEPVYKKAHAEGGECRRPDRGLDPAHFARRSGGYHQRKK